MSQVFYIGQKVVRTTEYYGSNDRPMCRGSIYTVSGVSYKGKIISVKEVDGEYSAENFRPAGWQDNVVKTTAKEPSYTIEQISIAITKAAGFRQSDNLLKSIVKELAKFNDPEYTKYLELKKKFETN